MKLRKAEGKKMKRMSIVILMALMIITPVGAESLLNLDGSDWIGFTKGQKVQLIRGYIIAIAGFSIYLIGKGYITKEEAMSYEVDRMNTLEIIAGVDTFYKQTGYFDWPLLAVIPQRFKRPGKEYK